MPMKLWLTTCDRCWGGDFAGVCMEVAALCLSAQGHCSIRWSSTHRLLCETASRSVFSQSLCLDVWKHPPGGVRRFRIWIELHSGCER